MKIQYLFFLGLVACTIFPSDAFAQIWPFSSSNPQQTIVHTETINSFNDFNPITHQGTFQTHPDYLLDYTNYKGVQVFIPYNIDDNLGYVNFESAHNSVTFYKDSCTARVFDGGHIDSNDTSLINNVSFNLQYAQNGTDNWSQHPANSQACTITHDIKGNTITFDLVQSIQGDVTKDVQFVFDLEHQNAEVIPKVTNNNDGNIDTKYGWAITLRNVPKVGIQNQVLTDSNVVSTIQYDQHNNQNYQLSIQGDTTVLRLDPQNNINHYLWATKIQPDTIGVSVILDYKNAPNALAPHQTLAIDPTWTSGS